MGGVTTPALAAAVAAEGGLGMVAAAGLTSDQVRAQVAEALALACNDARVESVGAVTGVLPAAAVVRELIRDAEAVLQRAAVDRREHGG